VVPVAMKELTTSGRVFSAKTTPAIGQHQSKSVRQLMFLASVAVASSSGDDSPYDVHAQSRLFVCLFMSCS
jgi:hypothetical protein